MPTSPITEVVPILCVTDMTRSLAFYKRLGFSGEPYTGIGGGHGYAFLTRDGWQLHLTQADSLPAAEHPGNGVYFYLAPGTAATLEAEFRAAGVPIQSPLASRPWRMLEFVTLDPDNNLLRFGEHCTTP